MLVATGILLAAWLLIAPACLWAQSGAVLEVGKFSASQVGTGVARWVEAAHL